MPILAGFSERGESTVQKIQPSERKVLFERKQEEPKWSKLEAILLAPKAWSGKRMVEKISRSCAKMRYPAIDFLITSMGPRAETGIRSNHKPEETEELLI